MTIKGEVNDSIPHQRDFTLCDLINFQLNAFLFRNSRQRLVASSLFPSSTPIKMLRV